MSDKELADEGLDYCRRLIEAGERAAASGDAVDHDLELAAVRLRISFAQARLADMFGAALSHLSAEIEEPDLRLAVFDGRSGSAPDPPWEWKPPGTVGQPLGRYEDERVSIVMESRDRTVTAFDRRRRRAAIWTSDADALPADERDTKLRYPLQVLLGAAGRPMIHAALVGDGDAGCLLPGPSGSGKSTLAIAAAQAGMAFCSDDYIVLNREEMRGHALLRTTKLARDSAGWLGLAAGADGRPRSFGDRGLVDKATIDVREIAPHAFRPRMRIATTVVPRLGGQGTGRLSPVSAAVALRALAPTTLRQQPWRDRGLLAEMATIVRAVPCYELDLSPHPAANAEALRRLVAGTA